MRQFYYQLGLILLILLGLGQSLKADRILSAYKKLQKAEYDKVRELLDKELEKNSEAAGAFHVWSLYFFDQQNPQYHLDSAYFMVKKALEFYPKTDPKVANKWQVEGIYEGSAKTHKVAIESAAFAYAQSESSLKDWEHFLNLYAEAEAYPQAIVARNILAWQAASQANTLVAYQQFLQNYPNAEQVEEARRRRDRFVYEQATSSGTLNNYQSFLQNNPNSYYANEARNKLFELATLEHTLEAYDDFVKQYPQGDAAKKAHEWIAAFYAEKNDLKNYLNLYPNAPEYARFQRLAEVSDLQYLPFYKEELFGYIDEQGKVRLPNNYEYVPRDYLCETIEDNYLIININERLGLIDKLGMLILEPKYDVVTHLGTGLFRVTKNARQGLFFQSGRPILPLNYDAIDILNTHFLKVRKNRRWGLTSYNGKSIVNTQFADIEILGEHFVLFRNANRYAILSNQALFKMATESREEITPRYDKAELINGQYALLRKDSLYFLYDQKGKWLFKNAKEIKALADWGWAVKRDSNWCIYRGTQKLMSDSSFQDIAIGGEYIALKHEGKWGVKDKNTKTVKPFEYDEIRFIDQTLLATTGKKQYLIFLKNPEVPEIDVTAFRNIRGDKGNYPKAEVFVHYESRTGKKGLYAQSGTKILSPKYDNFYILDPSTINVQSYGKYGLVDTLQKLALPIRYDGITNLAQGYKVLLQQGKFGLYNRETELNLRPEYSSAPILFAQYDSTIFFVVEKRGKKGLINQKGKAVLSAKYEGFLPISAQQVFVQESSDNWKRYDLSKAELVDTLGFNEVELVGKSMQGQSFFKVTYQNKQGVIKGENLLMPCEFDLIQNLGRPERPVFFAEKRNVDNQFYEVSYFNAEGVPIWQVQLNELDYYKLICE